MKFDQRELEIRALSHLTKNPKSMDKLLSRQISKQHFIYKEKSEEVSFTNKLFKFVNDYWSESGGSLFNSYVLESTFNKYRMKDQHRSKFLSLWTEIEDCEIDDNEFHEVLSQLKNQKCMSIISSMLTEGQSKLQSDGLGNFVKVLQDNLEEIQNQLSEINGDRQNFDVSQSSTLFKDEYEKRLYHPELFKGINSGISNIDSKTFGWLPGQIIVFLAPSSGGKSVMLLNTALHANKECHKKVLYMSFEMNSWLCLLRHVALKFEIPYSHLKDTNLSHDELKMIIEGLDKDSEGPYFEYDVNMEDPTPEYIDSRIRDLIATKGKPDLLVVDYIGNMTIRNPTGITKDWELQSKAIQQLFIMAKRYNIPIITAQQINRETIRDSRKSKEANKFMSYDQAAASGGQNLMHLCTYAIAMEPNREKGYCVLHPVKMRDAWFHPFPIRMNPEFNKVEEMSIEEQQNIMALHAMANGATAVPTSSVPASQSKTPMPKPKAVEDDDFYETIDTSDDEEIVLADWVLNNG
jgi:hypothetical protein